jgi:argininosuccinate lyase
MKAAFMALRVNREAMRAALDTGFLAATDFADATARALGIAFRAAYDLAARAVRLSGEAGRITAEAAAQALRQAGHDPGKVQDVLAALADPARILAWRTHTGSPAPQQVRAQLATLHAELEQAGAFILRRREQWDTAWRRCREWGG